MRYLKKVLAVLIILSMLFTSNAVFVFADGINSGKERIELDNKNDLEDENIREEVGDKVDINDEENKDEIENIDNIFDKNDDVKTSNDEEKGVDGKEESDYDANEQEKNEYNDEPEDDTISEDDKTKIEISNEKTNDVFDTENDKDDAKSDNNIEQVDAINTNDTINENEDNVSLKENDLNVDDKNYGDGTKIYKVIYNADISQIPTDDYDVSASTYNLIPLLDTTVEIDESESIDNSNIRIKINSDNETEYNRTDIDMQYDYQNSSLITWVLTGWNTSVDGSGNDYQGGTELTESDFTLDTADNIYKLQLYPKWEIPTLLYIVLNNGYKKYYNIGESIDLTGLMMSAGYAEYDAGGCGIWYQPKMDSWVTFDPPLNTLTSLQESDTNVRMTFNRHTFDGGSQAYVDLPIIVGKKYNIKYEQNYPTTGTWGEVGDTLISDAYSWDVDLTDTEVEINDERTAFITAMSVKGNARWMISEATSGAFKKLKGWNTKADGTGTTYNINQQIAAPNNNFQGKILKLYAVWEDVPIQKFAICYKNAGTSDWVYINSYDVATYFDTLLNGIGTGHTGFYKMEGITTIDDSMLTSYDSSNEATITPSGILGVYTNWVNSATRTNVVYGACYDEPHFYVGWTSNGGNKAVEPETGWNSDIDEVVGRIEGDKLIGWYEITPTRYSISAIDQAYNPNTTAALITTDELKNLFNTWSGDRTVSVAYGAKTAKFNSISVKAGTPDTTSYIADAHIDPTGLIIVKNYSDGSIEEIPYAGNEASFEFNPSLTDALTVSNRNVRVTYGTKTTTYNITVRNKQVISIELTPGPSKTTYLAGEAIDPTGMQVKVNYDNGTNDVLSYVDHQNEITFNPSRTTALTTNITSVEVGYKGQTATYNITVTEPTDTDRVLTGIVIKQNPAKVNYNKNEILDVTALEITLKYSDDTEEDVPYLGNEAKFVFVPSIGSKLVNEKDVKVYYNAKQTSYNVKVGNSNSGIVAPVYGGMSSSGGNGFRIVDNAKVNIDLVTNKLNHSPVNTQFVISKTLEQNLQYQWERKDGTKWSTRNSTTSRYYTGWALIEYNGSFDWYHFDQNGDMNTGWYTEDNKTYYFDTQGIWEGRLLTGDQMINGVMYKFGDNGVYIKK